MTDTKVPTELLTDVVDFVESTGEILAAREKQASEVTVQAKLTLDTLKKQGLAQTNVDETKQLALLSNPVEALKALAKTAELVTPAKLGRSEGGTNKTASMSKQSADQQFEVALGLA